MIDLRFNLYASPHSLPGIDVLVKIGRAEHHAAGGYSFDFAKPTIGGLRRWILASVRECRTWDDFGLTEMPDTMDDIHVWHEGSLVCVGTRLPRGYCEDISERLLLVPRPDVSVLPSHATGFHSLPTCTPCPLEGCKAMACPARPLCVFHWAELSDADRAEVWRDATMLPAVVERRKLGTLCPAASSPALVVDTPSRVRRPRSPS